jgi:SRSO17 transposase
VRVGVGHHKLIPESLAQEWLLIEWPKGEAEPIKYWLSTLPAEISFRRLVDFAKLRWRIERDYQEFKQEVGLGHFEGCGWARLPSSRHALHRSLRVPDLREGDDSPLTTSFRRAAPGA